MTATSGTVTATAATVAAAGDVPLMGAQGPLQRAMGGPSDAPPAPEPATNSPSPSTTSTAAPSHHTSLSAPSSSSAAQQPDSLPIPSHGSQGAAPQENNNPQLGDDQDPKSAQSVKPTASDPPSSLDSHRQDHSSSKLPAFRFADRHSSAATDSSPSLAPRGLPSPVSPSPHSLSTDTGITAPTPDSTSFQSRDQDQPAPPLNPASLPGVAPLSPRSRAATYHTSVSAQSVAPVPRDRSTRPTSLPDSSPGRNFTHAPATAPIVTTTDRRDYTYPTRRALASRSSSESAVSEGYLTSRNRQRILAAATDKSTKEGASGRRELLLPKTLSQTTLSHERRDSGSNRPPVSYKPPSSGSVQSVPSTPVRVPPIRGFRSSFSRKSLNLDMNFSRPFELSADEEDPNHDHTLRALEGRRGSDLAQVTSPISMSAEVNDTDDGGDMFLRIARQESGHRGKEGSDHEDTQSSVSRVLRTSHRRPLSTNVASYHPTSPTQLTRRLSDQQETVRTRRHLDDRAAEFAPSSTQRAIAREKAASIHPGDETLRLRSAYVSPRPSPFTPRVGGISQDSGPEIASQSRRRSSITESHAPQIRTPVHKSYAPITTSASKAYCSSPLVRSFDLTSQHQERTAGPEGTESTLSTAAPSTVWDELDDIRSRINRLELTGKLPSTSGAAVSRLSDERPPTATTTVTTVSSSPKRFGAGVAQTDVGSTTSSQREAHPVLNTALSKSKAHLKPDVFRALESAANDAMALSSMMGLPGQPGPISSGTSTIGTGTTITDRQLRRKADSVCRSLTELCVALGEDVRSSKAAVVQQPPAAAQTDGQATPVVVTSSQGQASSSQRRPSVTAESNILQPQSPKSMSKFEERRHTLLHGSLLPSPRVSSSTPATPVDAASNRRSSLLISRTRRAGTEEPEEGRASVLTARGRRAGTEEPEEGRKTSLLVRNRRGTIGEEDVESRLRAPSRATTEVNATRTYRDYSGQAQAAPQEATAAGYSALPRRRIPSSINTSRLTSPAAVTTPPARRYLERSAAPDDASPQVETPTESRSHRLSMIGHSSLPARTSTITSRRQNRDSTITNVSTAATAGGGPY